MTGVQSVTSTHSADQPALASLLLVAALAAATAALLYMVSPLTTIAGGVMIWIVWRAVDGVSGWERAWALRLLLGAILLRAAAVALLLAFTDPERQQFLALFPDAKYLTVRSVWIRNLWLGVPIGAQQYDQVFRPYAESSYLFLLAALQTVFGPAPYGLNFLSMLFFVGSVVLAYRLVRESFGAVPSIVGA